MNLNPFSPSEPTAEVRQVTEAVESVILRKVEALQMAKSNLKNFKETRRNIYDNDKELSDLEDQASRMKQEVTRRKKQLGNNNELLQLTIKEIETKQEIKELREDLNNQAYAYSVSNGTNTIADSDGLEITIEPKISIKVGQLKLF